MVALITGASSGIGRDIARELCGRGYDLIIAARRLDRLEELAGELDCSVRCIKVDLSQKQECLRLYDEVKDENIDLLINNAGFGDFGEFVDTDLERDIEMINTNITAVHILTKLFLRDFVKKNSGRILNVASSAGFMAGPKLSTYYATKNYVVRLTEAICEELRRNKSRVTVSAFCPGPVATEFDQVAKVKFSLGGQLSSQYAAKFAVKHFLRGKLLIVPNGMKAAKLATRFVSEKLMLKISYHIQNRKG